MTAVCVQNFTETATDLGWKLVQNVWRVLEVRINSASTNVDFYVDGTLATSITTNIPTGSGRQTNIAAQALRTSATGTNIAFDVDWMYVYLAQPSAPIF